MWADNVKFVKDIVDSKYAKIETAAADVRAIQNSSIWFLQIVLGCLIVIWRGKSKTWNHLCLVKILCWAIFATIPCPTIITILSLDCRVFRGAGQGRQLPQDQGAFQARPSFFFLCHFVQKLWSTLTWEQIRCIAWYKNIQPSCLENLWCTGYTTIFWPASW